MDSLAEQLQVLAVLEGEGRSTSGLAAAALAQVRVVARLADMEATLSAGLAVAVAAAVAAMQQARSAVALVQLMMRFRPQLARRSRLGRAACLAVTPESSSRRSWGVLSPALLLLAALHLEEEEESRRRLEAALRCRLEAPVLAYATQQRRRPSPGARCRTARMHWAKSQPPACLQATLPSSAAAEGRAPTRWARRPPPACRLQRLPAPAHR